MIRDVDGQSVDADTALGHRDHGACVQLFLHSRHDAGQQLSQSLSPQTFTADAHYGRPGHSGYREQCVEIGVKGNDDPMVGAGVLKDLAIVRGTEPDFAHVDRIDTLKIKVPGSAPGRSLIQQEAHQAAPSWISSSSK